MVDGAEGAGGSWAGSRVMSRKEGADRISRTAWLPGSAVAPSLSCRHSRVELSQSMESFGFRARVLPRKRERRIGDEGAVCVHGRDCREGP